MPRDVEFIQGWTYLHTCTYIELPVITCTYIELPVIAVGWLLQETFACFRGTYGLFAVTGSVPLISINQLLRNGNFSAMHLHYLWGMVFGTTCLVSTLVSTVQLA